MSKELLALNVNGHTEKKGALTYLSWAWAWAEVLKHDPAALWCVHQYGPQGNEQPCMWIGETAIVHTSVTIHGIRRECMLPVMDNKNAAIKNPDARKVSDSIMRCMTKAIAMHGLGLYIYAGEDLPEHIDSPEEIAAAAQREKRGRELDELADVLIEQHQAGQDMKAFALWYSADTWDSDVGERGEEQKYVWGLLGQFSKLRSAIKANRPTEQTA